MPAQTSQSEISALLKKYAAQGRAAHTALKDTPTKEVNMALPAGIENGVAQLRSAKLGIFQQGENKGKLYFMAQASVVTPEEFKGIPIKGMLTKVGPIPLCDTPKSLGKKTFGEHYQDVLDCLDRLGVSRSTYNFDTLETKLAELSRRKPFFAFRTWKGPKQEVRNKGGKFYVVSLNDDGKETGASVGPFPSEVLAKAAAPFAGRDPRVNEQWARVIPNYKVDGQKVALAAVDTSNGDKSTDTAESPTDELPPDATDTDVTESEVTDSVGTDPDADGALTELASAAQGDDATAQQKLTDIAVAAGVDEGEVLGANSWLDVIDMIRTAQGSSAAEPAEEPEPDAPIEPEKGQLVRYRPLDAKTKKPAKKAVECEVMAVSKDKRTCVLKNMDTKVILKGIPFDALEPE
jgi:hypothetical protein